MRLIRNATRIVTTEFVSLLAVLCFVTVAALGGCGDELVCPTAIFPAISVMLENGEGDAIIRTEQFTFEYRVEPDEQWTGCGYDFDGSSSACGIEEAGTFSARAYDDTRFGMQSGIRVTMGECNVRTQEVTLTVTEGSVPE